MLFHIFSLPNFFQMVYSMDNILKCMTNIDIYFYVSNPYIFSKYSHEHA